MQERKIVSTRNKIIGEILLAIPGILFALFAFGETANGTPGGISHFIQLIPVIIFAFVCWFYPKKGGVILIMISVIFFILYFLSFSQTPILQRIINDLIIFGTPITAGVLFIFAKE